MGEHAPPIAVVGLIGGRPFGEAALAAVAGADVAVGSARHLALLGNLTALPPRTVDLSGPLTDVLDSIQIELSGARCVCVLASGDPGFFGIVRVLSARFGSERVQVFPAPSSVALAFARIGVSWDDAVVVSAHGRPLADAVAAAMRAPKAAILTAPDTPPQLVGAALVEAGCGPRCVTVVTRIGEPAEQVASTDLAGLAGGTFDPLSVVLLRAPSPPVDGPGLAWGQPDDAFDHRDGMITKAEVRAVALGKLSLPRAGVLWDVGAGSGSVGIEAARVAPGLRVYAIEQHEADADRVAANASTHMVAIDIVRGVAPVALAGLPDPDRVFIGGGGLDVLDACLERLRPGGVVVANYALVDRAVMAYGRLGSMVEVTVGRAAPLADGTRLVGENPVFVCWGPATS